MLTAAAWFSLAVAAVDAAVAATPWSDHWRTIGAALRSTPWVIVLSLGIAAAGAALLKLLLRRSERADDAVAALLAAGAVGFSVLRWFGMVGALRRPFSHGAEIATAAAAAGVTAAAVWWSGRDSHRFDSLGLVAVVGAAACWTGVYSTSAPAGRYGVWLAGAVLAAVAWQALAKLPEKTQASAGVAAVAALTGAGFLAARSPGAYFQPVQDAPLSQADGPPILLLSIDTLRWESVSFLNPDAPKTPHLDSLAADSLVFERAYSSGSWTLTSMASALTGMHARTHQLDGDEKWIVPAQASLLAETLSEAGYRTAAAADNPWLQASGGFARGMESFAHFPRSSESIGSRLDRKLGPDTTATLTWLAREWIS